MNKTNKDTWIHDLLGKKADKKDKSFRVDIKLLTTNLEIDAVTMEDLIADLIAKDSELEVLGVTVIEY